jgi:hypothetical protein
MVLAGGELQIGTAANPVAANVSAQVIFPDQALDLVHDPEQFGNGLIALGKVTIYGAAKNQTFLPLAVEPHAGDTTLTLSQPVTGWRAGDRLELPDTRQLTWETSPDNPDAAYYSQRELPTITSVSADGRTVTLTQPLVYDHLGARDGDGVLTFLPDVANLTRNVVIRSANARGVRGHTLFTGRADVDIHFAQFAGLGRTTVDGLDSTTLDPSGAVTHLGTNETGRYSVNFRDLVGPSSPQVDGYQFTFQGNSVFCPLDPMTFRWGIALHDSSYGLIQDNVLYNWAGAGIVTDTGNEVYNVIAHNLVTRITQAGRWVGRPDDRGMFGPDLAFEGSAFWLRGGTNYVRDNVVSEARIGYTYYARGNPIVTVPVAQGADPSQPGQSQTVELIRQPILEFARNEVYGGWTDEGLTIWNLGAQGGFVNPNQAESVIKDFRAWNVKMVYYNYETKHVTFDGLVARGNFANLATGQSGTALYAGDYQQVDFAVRNSDIQGFSVGIDAGPTTGTTQVIENSYLRNYVDILVTPQFDTASAVAPVILPRTTVINNVRFGSVNVADGTYNFAKSFICMDGRPTAAATDFVTGDKVLVYQYNGVAGDDFRLYYQQQAANAVIPSTTYFPDGTTVLSLGSPAAGLTNARAWQQYGIAFAGAVAPLNSTTRSDVFGLVGSL